VDCKAPWLVFGLVVVTVVIVGCIALALLLPGPVSANGMHGLQAQRDCSWCGVQRSEPGSPIATLGVLFLLAAPLLLFTLLGGGLAWFVRSSRPLPVSPSLNCPNCGRRASPDWQVCPYCAGKLEIGS